VSFLAGGRSASFDPHKVNQFGSTPKLRYSKAIPLIGIIILPERYDPETILEATSDF